MYKHSQNVLHAKTLTFHCGSAADAFDGGTLKFSIRLRAAETNMFITFEHFCSSPTYLCLQISIWGLIKASFYIIIAAEESGINKCKQGPYSPLWTMYANIKNTEEAD